MEIPGITPLWRHPETVPLFAAAYRQAWPDWYGDGGPGDAAAFLSAACRRDGLPTGLLALDAGKPAGTIVVNTESGVGRQYPGPWLASLFVLPAHRGRGIAMRLVDAAERVTASLGIDSVYIGVTDLEPALLRRGYRLQGREVHGEQAVAILCRQLPDA